MPGSELRKLRKRKKITQTDLAECLGASRQAVSMWETGKRELKVKTLKKIAQIFKTTMEKITIQDSNNLTDKEEAMAKSNKQKKINFQLVAPEAEKVVLTGNFNSWDETGIALKKNKSGLWKIGIKLEEGRYEYKFIVDNQWWTDPGNDNQSPNSFGELNSVMEVST